MTVLMKTTGIRILDSKDHILNVTLGDILQEVKRNNAYLWSLLFLDGISSKNEGNRLKQFENEINSSENGVLIDWKELTHLSDRFYQMYETILLGSKDPQLLRRYQTEAQMYQSCDIVIELIDCAFWEVHSKDSEFINRLKRKFKETENI